MLRILRWCAVGLCTAAPLFAAGKIAALARIQPLDGVLTLEGPAGDAIAEMRVSEDQTVDAGEPLVVLQSEPAARAEVALAETALRELREQQPLALARQQAAVRQAEADAQFAARQLRRFDASGTEKIAPQVYDQHAHQAASAKVAAELARTRLTALELQHATALQRAEAQLAAARARLDRAVLRAPTAGTVLEISAGAGEATGRRPILRFADLTRMGVVAEVFESELAHVRVGSRAQIASKSLRRPVSGKVVSVGRIISGSGKVGKVKIAVDDPEAIAGLIEAEVDVMIDR